MITRASFVPRPLAAAASSSAELAGGGTAPGILALVSADEWPKLKAKYGTAFGSVVVDGMHALTAKLDERSCAV